jgi:hypothetical protein
VPESMSQLVNSTLTEISKRNSADWFACRPFSRKLTSMSSAAAFSQPTIGFKGISGQAYTFNVHSWGTPLKSIGGIYVVTRAKPNLQGGRTHDVLYVGQTGDLSERFDAHHKADSFRRHGATDICARVEQSERARLNIEADLIAAYNPPCNG